MTDGFGAITWWGFSPALDLQDEYSEITSKLSKLNLDEKSIKNNSDVFNILMIGAGDCRHILKTLAYTTRHRKKHINIYVVENNLEILCRHLLLLAIAMETKEKLGLQEKTQLFLELFGNSLIRPQTSEYLQKKSNEFIRMVTDFDYLKTQLPCTDMTQLKFKERDMMEGIFKFWRNADTKMFDICKCWESRLRQYLQVRYDSRENVFDWDLVMKLQKKASIVNSYEYKGWREHGVAFELRQDSTYEVCNRTLASGLLLMKGGQKIPCRGYWGDIINSPYISFGVESEENSLFKKNNNQHTKTASIVSEYNITALIHDLNTGQKYQPPKDTKEIKKQNSATITEIIEEEEEEQQDEKKEEVDDKTVGTEEEGYEKIDGFTVHFLPLNCVADLHKKSKYSHRFDCIYFSNSMVHLLDSETPKILADKAMVVIETTRFMLDLQEEQKAEYLKRVTGMACAAGFKSSKEYDAENDSHVSFVFERTSDKSS